MSESSWRNGFALGLTALVCGAIVMFIATSSLLAAARCYENERNSDASWDATQNTEEQCQEPEWWHWASRLVSLEDSPAQWIMAILSVVAVGVSAWAVVLVKDTLNQTKRSVDVAIDSNQRQLRAYLAVPIVVPVINAEEIIGFTIDIVNGGQTPASFVSFVATYRWVKNPDTDPMPNPISKTGGSRGIVIPGRKVTLSSFAVKGGAKRLADGFSLCVVCRVVYRDIFNKKHQTLFRGYVDSEILSQPDPGFFFSKRNNRMT